MSTQPVQSLPYASPTTDAPEAPYSTFAAVSFALSVSSLASCGAPSMPGLGDLWMSGPWTAIAIPLLTLALSASAAVRAALHELRGAQLAGCGAVISVFGIAISFAAYYLWLGAMGG